MTANGYGLPAIPTCILLGLLLFIHGLHVVLGRQRRYRTEATNAFGSEVALHHARRNSAEVEEDEAVERVVEVRIEVHTENFATEVCILAEQDREPLTVWLQFLDLFA